MKPRVEKIVGLGLLVQWPQSLAPIRLLKWSITILRRISDGFLSWFHTYQNWLNQPLQGPFCGLEGIHSEDHLYLP